MKIETWVKRYIKNRKEAYKLQQEADKAGFTREELELKICAIITPKDTKGK